MNLKYGSVGQDVITLQTALNKLGTSPQLSADGIFGQQTLLAVQNFQRQHGLAVDGIVGPNTQAAITALLGGTTPIPTGFTYAVDMYHGDTFSDINAFAASNFALVRHKITEGNGHVDTSYASRRKAVQGVGKLFGAYIYIHPNQSASSQVDLFMKTNGDVADNEYQPAIDWEEEDGMSNAQMNDCVEQMVELIKTKTGRTADIYSSYGQLAGYGARPALTRCGLWVADLRSGPGPRIPSPWSTYSMWQYSFTANVAGIGNPCDANKFPGTLQDLIAAREASKK